MPQVKTGANVILYPVELDNANIKKVFLQNPLTNSEAGAPQIGIKVTAGGVFYDIYQPLDAPESQEPYAWFKRADGKTVKLGGGVGLLDNYIVEYNSQLQKNVSQCLIIRAWHSSCFEVPGPFKLSFDVYVNGYNGQNGYRRTVLIIEGYVEETKTSTLITS